MNKLGRMNQKLMPGSTTGKKNGKVGGRTNLGGKNCVRFVVRPSAFLWWHVGALER